MQIILRTLLGVFFTALVAAVFAISFAAIVYSGDLSQFLDRGIGLTLLGAVVISLVGAATLSYRGSILGPQDLPAILLASGAAGIAAQTQLSDEVMFATVACLVAVTSIVTGGLGYLLGTFRISYVARLFPYPVLAGFLATTGLLLFLGGIDIALGPYQVIAWADYTAPDAVMRWAPMVVIAGAMVFATRKWSGFLVMPMMLFAALAAYFVFYAVVGMPMSELSEAGFLLGPFQAGGFATALDPTLPLRADWPTIILYAPLIITTALSALLGTTLNASGLELALKRDLDIDQEIKGSGLANVLSGLVGGLPGYHVVGETLLANRLGLLGAAAGLSSAAACALLLVLGGSALSYLPLGFFAAVIAFLGLDLILTWLWQERRNMDLMDYCIVLLIPLIAVVYGFLTAIAVGLMAACFLFVLAYGKLEIIRRESDMSTRRSLVERPNPELDALGKAGGAAKIIELSTFLFFGTSTTLRRKVWAALSDTKDLRWLILDFRRVYGLDISTRHVLERIQNDCDQMGLHLVLTGLSAKTMAEIEQRAPTMQMHATLEQAIETIEDRLIEEAEQSGSLGAAVSDQLEALFSDKALDQYTERMTVQAGTVVIEKGSPAQDIYLLLSGRLRVISPAGGQPEIIVAYIRPGSAVGEMAGYTQRPRSATIIADETCELLRIDLKLFPKLENEHAGIALRFHRLIAADMARRLDRTTAYVRELKD